MKLQFIILLLAALSFVQTSPLNGRNRRALSRQRANKEVRSIVSAIVDAILDGDRKRRSEVVDFDDSPKEDDQKKRNKATTKIFTKREEREADDNSVPLADVIATSDLNSKSGQTGVTKKDVIQHVSDENRWKDEPTFKELTSEETGDEMDTSTSSGLGTLNSFSQKPLEDETNTTRNVSSQSVTDSKKSDINDNNEQQSMADTYAEFLRLSKSPQSIEKHSAVEHISDDSAMNEDLESTDSEKANTSHEPSDSMDTDEESMSGPERNDDRMEDGKKESEFDSMGANDNEQPDSEEDDKMMNDRNEEHSDDDSGMDESGDDTMSGKDSAKESEMNSQSKTEKTADFSNQKDDSEMNSDEDSSLEEQARTPAGMGDGSGEDGKGSENDTSGYEWNSVGSGKDSMGSDSTGSDEDTKGHSENAKDDAMGSAEASREPQEESKEDVLGFTEDMKGSGEESSSPTGDIAGLKGDSTRNEKESQKVENLNSATTSDSENKGKSVDEDNASHHSDNFLSQETSFTKAGDGSETNSKDFDPFSAATESNSGAGIESKASPGSKPNSQENSETYAGYSKIDADNESDSSGQDEDLEQSDNAEEDDHLDSGSSLKESGLDKTTPKTNDEIENSVTEHKVNNNHDEAIYDQNSANDQNLENNDQHLASSDHNLANGYQNPNTNDENSANSDQYAANSNTNPVKSDRNSANSDSNQHKNNQHQDTTDQIPINSDQHSADRHQNQADIHQTPTSNNQNTANSDQNLTNNDETLENSGQGPSNNDQSSANSDQNLASGDQKPVNADENQDNSVKNKGNNNQKKLKSASKSEHDIDSLEENKTTDNDLDVETSEKDLRKKEDEVKSQESGKIMETSYRFNDDDSTEDDVNIDQANDLWTSTSNNLLAQKEYTDLSGNEAGIALDQDRLTQSDESTKYGNDLHIGSNDIYEDIYNKPTDELNEKTQGPQQSNDYNWLANGLTSSQPSNLNTIQDKQADYETMDLDGKEYTTSYSDNDGLTSRRGYQTTERPELEKRTSIPRTKDEQPEYATNGVKRASNNAKRFSKSSQIKSKHYTAPEALTDNDVYGYTGSIGPFLQKRTTVPYRLGKSDNRFTDENSERTKKDDVLEDLITDVNEPWIKNFLTNTLEMAVNGDKRILTSDQDGGQYEGTHQTRRDNVEVDSAAKFRKENDVQNKYMPPDGTNDKDDGSSEDYVEDKDDENSKQKEKTGATGEKSQDTTELATAHQDIPTVTAEPAPKPAGIPLSEVIKHSSEVETPQSPVADIGTIQPNGTGRFRSVIRITARVPVARRIPEQNEVTSSQLPSTQMIPETPQLPPSISPQQPEILPPEMPADMDTTLSNFPLSPVVENKLPTQVQISKGQATNSLPSPPIVPPPPVPGITESNQQAPPLIGPIIKVITTPRKTSDKSNGEARDSRDGNTKIQSEIKNALNNSIQNIGISFSNDVLENTIKEAELLHVLKDAIPVNQRRPAGTDDDIKQGLENLKDYAIALSEATGLSQAQRDDVAEKLARDLLDEMRVIDGRKQELLKELMSYVTAMEISIVKERLNEIKSRVLQESAHNPDDIAKIRSTATRLLDELFEQLPLPKDQIKDTEKKLGESKLLKSLIKAGEKRILRRKLKKALVDLVADKLL